ncbi:Wzz/FepE/Etk N-terminal domain-containing protein, partial [Klebsiella pneumoniae]|uniref:Wzz/FepE/Etk N-terminal domain-containing protein n=1 Tax=Klebsiella pneumoniae TaxID=573 RepID=UPI003969A085
MSKSVRQLIKLRKVIIALTSFASLIALLYAFFATPIYKADALIQVEQKQANAILSNLSQMLPDSQP